MRHDGNRGDDALAELREKIARHVMMLIVTMILSQRYAVDDAKLKELGWETKIDWQHGLAEVIDWYKSKCQCVFLHFPHSLGPMVGTSALLESAIGKYKPGVLVPPCNVFLHICFTDSPMARVLAHDLL